MGILEKILILERLHKLIQMRYKGSAEDYANRVNISRSSLFNYINELKGMGAHIEYSRTLYCFIYLNEFVLEIKIESLSDEKIKNIFGGNNIYFSESNYLYGRCLHLNMENNQIYFSGNPTPVLKFGKNYLS